jgi:tight adherence protein B
MTPEAILASAAAGLAVLVGASMILLARDAKQRRLAVRIAERVTPLAAAKPPARRFSEKFGIPELVSVVHDRLGGICGFSKDRQDAYPLRIPLLLLLAVVPAVVIERLATRVVGVPLDLALPLFWLACCQLLFRNLHSRYADKLYRQFPDALSMIVRSVRAGVPLHEALRVVARESLEPTAGQFTRICDQLAIGIRLDDALRDAASRTGVPEYSFFTVALTLQMQTGGSLGETLENLGDVIRKRVALRLRGHALASEARTSAYVLSALPVFAGLALTVLNFDYIRPLFETTRGNRVLFTAVFMLGFAGLVMRTMIRRCLR